MISVRIDHYFHGTNDAALARIEQKLDALLEEVHMASAGLARLTTEVGEMRGEVASAVRAFEGIADLIRENAANETEMNKLADDLDATAAQLAAAIPQNPGPTPPAPPEPTPEPAPNP